MPRFRKKPVVVEATQWLGFAKGPHDLGIVSWRNLKPSNQGGRWEEEELGWIETLEGGHQVTPGDWIITGVKGEKYPCKPDIFEMTYEPAD